MMGRIGEFGDTNTIGRHQRGECEMTLRSFSKGLVPAAMVVAAAYVGLANGADDDSQRVGRGPDTYTIGLFGDMPYNALGKAQYPSLLADINAKRVAFSVFDGDLKAGGDGACTDSLYTTALDHFNSLDRPLIFLPGDNDWTDCWGRYGPGNGGFDPLERLNFERLL